MTQLVECVPNFSEGRNKEVDTTYDTNMFRFISDFTVFYILHYQEFFSPKFVTALMTDWAAFFKLAGQELDVLGEILQADMSTKLILKSEKQVNNPILKMVAGVGSVRLLPTCVWFSDHIQFM